MYAVEVRDHIMIAHSLKGEVFGPAQGMHGATFVVDVAFFRETLDSNNIVVDIGLATEALKSALKPLNYANLDERPEFHGQVTTTEFLCRHIFEQMAAAIERGDLGPDAGQLAALRVTLHESHVARAWLEAPLPRA
jgi:6-pyruvoyl-tetrahydropterin synthase